VQEDICNCWQECGGGLPGLLGSAREEVYNAPAKLFDNSQVWSVTEELLAEHGVRGERLCGSN
jgi:hypothetical protein